MVAASDIAFHSLWTCGPVIGAGCGVRKLGLAYKFTGPPTRTTLCTRHGSGLEFAVPYIASVLRELGYRATARLSRTWPPSHSRFRTWQLAATGFLDPTAASFFETWADCSSTSSAHGWVCDPAVDRTIQSDVKLEAVNPRAAYMRWATLDRKLVQRADWVPLVNARWIDFVSPRVSGYEYNPEPGFGRRPALAALNGGDRRKPRPAHSSRSDS